MNYAEKEQTRDDKFKAFLGSKISSLEIDEKKEFLKVITDRGEFVFVAVGDCCSRSWIEHINNFSNAIGGTVIELPRLYPDAYERNEIKEDYETIQNYQTSIKTDKGELNIEYRNSSNGYYGGWLAFECNQYGDEIDMPETKTVNADF